MCLKGTALLSLSPMSEIKCGATVLELVTNYLDPTLGTDTLVQEYFLMIGSGTSLDLFNI